MKKLDYHPFANQYPLPPSHEIDEMSADIKKNGQRVPIVLYGGKILDGRCRFLACQRAGVEPKTVQFMSKKPQEYVTSMNLLRRHLSTTDRAKVAALMSIESEVGRPSSDEENTTNGAITQVEAAKIMKVSPRTVQRAKAKIQGKTNAKKETYDGNDLKDDSGVPIPNAARPYWRRKGEAQEIISKIASSKKAVKALLPDDPMYAEVNLNGVMADLNNAQNRFASAIPAHVCPYCKGVKPDGCKACKSRGVVSDYFYKTAVPEEMKK